MRRPAIQLSVRLTLLLAAICVAFLMIGGSAEADQPVPPPTEYVVAAGDTLWAIASARVGPGEDVRSMISQIAALSGVENGSIFPGQILLIPAG